MSTTARVWIRNRESEIYVFHDGYPSSLGLALLIVPASERADARRVEGALSGYRHERVGPDDNDGDTMCYLYEIDEAGNMVVSDLGNDYGFPETTPLNTRSDYERVFRLTYPDTYPHDPSLRTDLAKLTAAGVP
jgi:hypothetical protein